VRQRGIEEAVDVEIVLDELVVSLIVLSSGLLLALQIEQRERLTWASSCP
jgi:hypothetical protein